MKKIIIFLIMMIMVSCSSQKIVPIENKEIVYRVDTVYKNKIQYDSIWIWNDSKQSIIHDTILIEKTKLEYRYKMLRDTVRENRIDSVYLFKTKVITQLRPLSKFDILCRCVFITLVLSLIVWGIVSRNRLIRFFRGLF